jgi:ABC-type antimicrobial peptide transport system permease subunit
LLESQLFGITSHDPVVLLASIGLLGLTAAWSIYIPARRAAKADPMVALRYE